MQPRTASDSRLNCDRGGAAILVLGLTVAMMAISLAAVMPLMIGTINRQRAQTAADAAALAGVPDGCAAAGRFAVANKAQLVSCEIVGADIIVEVKVGEITARARATDSGPQTNE